MSENFHYYGKHKRQNKTVAQLVVVQKRKLQFRMGGKDLEKFDKHKNYSDQDESNFIRSLINEALDERERKSWEEEVKNL